MSLLRAAKFTISCSVMLAAVATAALAQQPRAVALVGEWIFEMDGDAQPQRVRLALEADSVRGSVYGQKFAITIAGKQISFPVGSYRWRGSVLADSIAGWLVVNTDSSRWHARRYLPPAKPRAFTFSPRTFPRAYRARGTPALRLYSGDTVHTFTVDAGGWGAGTREDRSSKLSEGGNPLTGPFYVEGAVPGDVLAVTLHRVRPNRGWAFSGTSLINNAIEPGYAVNRTLAQQNDNWIIDTVAGVAKLLQPTPALQQFTVPLTPFLGVVAVAPGGEAAPSSRESGSYGGNLESANIREGATVYLPVSSMGAYLYIGDGHAAQGDGELTGDAMETSMDVSFSVKVVRWGFASQTRVENDEYIMSLGVAGSLDLAMRRATSDMAKWLEGTWKLTSTEAAIVMGFALTFEIPDVVLPGVGVTAKLPKSALRKLATPESTGTEKR